LFAEQINVWGQKTVLQIPTIWCRMLHEIILPIRLHSTLLWEVQPGGYTQKCLNTRPQIFHHPCSMRKYVCSVQITAHNLANKMLRFQNLLCVLWSDVLLFLLRYLRLLTFLGRMHLGFIGGLEKMHPVLDRESQSPIDSRTFSLFLSPHFLVWKI